MAALSSPGIGTNIDVTSIVSKLMAAESIPLNDYDTQSASVLGQVTAFGSLSGALGTFQSSLSSLTSLSSFQSLSATPGDSSILTGTADSTASPGSYRVTVSQVAQAQSLSSAGYASKTAAIGVGAKTTINFALGNVTGGSFGITGAKLGADITSSGLTPGGLTINGTTISTDGTTRSARALADAINAQSSVTGVSATTTATTTPANEFGSGGASSFGSVDTSGGGTYSLSIGGVQIAAQAAGVAAGGSGGITAASLDAALTGNTSVARALANANITVSGHASDGTLQFTDADGVNIAITEDVSGTVNGGIGNTASTANLGDSNIYSSSISLASADASQITVGGTAPGVAGLTAGTAGSYQGASFAQDATRTSGNIVIDSTNNSLQGIVTAINKGNFGVTASIVSDGSATSPYHLVLTSSATGASSTAQISLTGANGAAPDPALVSLLAYDPAGTQNLSQNISAQDTLANINGIAVSSSSTSITGAVPGVSVSVSKPGTTTLSVAQDSSSLTTAVTGFVSAYNALASQITQLSGYNATTQQAGPLLGNPTVNNLQAQLQKTLSQSITGLQSNNTTLTNLGQLGISFDKTGVMTLNTATLNSAITNNFGDIAGLFAAVGRGTDPDISFTSSSTLTQAGDYPVDITTLASQGTLTSAAPLAATTTIAPGTIWTVHLNDDGTGSLADSANVTLAPGTYTPTQLAALLQSSINGVSAFSGAGSTVSTTVDKNGNLVLNSTLYGSKSNISIVDDTGTSATTVFGSATPTVGVDVAGTIGGYSATGVGQSLTANPGAPASGLKLLVQGTATGARGSIGFSQGYAYQLNNLANNYLGSSGYISAQTTGLNATVADIAAQKKAFQSHLDDVQANYLAQFNALSASVASMTSTQDFLTQQFATMAKG